MRDLVFVLCACVLAAVVGFVTWDIANRKGYREGHHDGWNAHAAAQQEREWERRQHRPTQPPKGGRAS